MASLPVATYVISLPTCTVFLVVFFVAAVLFWSFHPATDFLVLFFVLVFPFKQKAGAPACNQGVGVEGMLSSQPANRACL